uniref:Uncharacterized protein n=1 Tax=Paulinella longichromatophora TaxID=1708747 RepID=A0A2H4ZQ28_9EUKA|nr:hypothetical protein PLO_652 [Paulinella longichromatophora]
MQSSNSNVKWQRIITAIIPLVGVLTFPALILIFITKGSLQHGISTALFVSTLWFILMLITSEMPHSDNANH